MDEPHHLVFEVDETTKPKKFPPLAENVFNIFKQEIGKYPLNWKTNKTQRVAAENLWNERGEDQIRKALQFHSESKDEKFCPEINSPWDLDTKWTKLNGFKKKQNG